METTTATKHGEEIEFKLDGVPYALNVIQRKFRYHHKRQSYYQGWYHKVALALKGKTPDEPWGFVSLHIKVCLPPRRFRDYDGLVASLKPIIDGLKKSGLIRDDNYKRTGSWLVEQLADKTTDDGFVIVKVIKEK